MKKVVRGDFSKCHQVGTGDHPAYCTFSGKVRCPTTKPVVINGDWELWSDYAGQSFDFTKAIETSDMISVTDLYNTRTAATTRRGPEGWTSAIATTDFTGFSEMWFGSPPFTQLVKFRVWALCGKRSLAPVLGR